jgi:hypothetical protein
VADGSGWFLTYPSFVIEVDDSSDCTIPCRNVSADTQVYDFDSRRHTTQHSSKEAVRVCQHLAFWVMHHSRLSALQKAQSHLKYTDPQIGNFPTVPVHLIPNSGASPIERINAFELKKYFGCRGLSDWTTLEHTGQGLHVVQDKDAPTTLGDITTISRNQKGKLLSRPPTSLHTVGMDIGYGEGTSPGGYKYALTLVDYAMRYTWTYGLKNKTAESVIDALWSFFVDAGGMPHRIRCDFDSSFVKGKVYKFLKLHKIQITSAPPNRQSQNGLVERQWRTAVAMARAMLIEARLPRRYWFWVLRESVIRMNLLPCKPTGKDGADSPTSTHVPPFDIPTPIPPVAPTPSIPPLLPSISPLQVAQPASTGPPGPSAPLPSPSMSVPSASDASDRRYAALTTPFKLFYGQKPDYYRVLFKWGCVGYYRRTSDSGIDRGNFDAQSSVGLALGRINQTNAMIFWDPATSRMNVSADYRLDPTASITSSYPNIIYDGHISPLVLRGGVNADKEPFPPGSKVTVLHDDEHLATTILSVPLSDQPDYSVALDDSPEHYLVPIEQITGEGEPVFHMISVEPNSPITASPPRMPEWIQDNTHVTIHHEGRQRRGMLQSTDQGWTFTQRTGSGRTTFTLDMADLPVSWEERLTEGSLELGWQAQARAYHISAKGITNGVPPSFRKSMESGYPDRRLWMESYVEEAMGLKEQDIYVVINTKDYEKNYQDIQVIPTMNVQTIKKDERGDPDQAKSHIVAL